ncbi:hypothetical protein GCM10025768_27610 [Microbacterium pseudoresistens]|uniref:Malate synthase N-terminal domain-containing protein n=1 Tax=Microbacterium pseudoresistens TaxID=640634 RepID=A0A7Y9EVR9_9MICO|nr:hypothetical protein [Microbacterium pseudoresistens]NYD54706.1 hypothetical protein [Microbacterium pseudoresistens]
MSIRVTRPARTDGAEAILTPEALAFVEELHQRFDGRRRELLAEEVAGPAARLVPSICLDDDVDFLTLPAYDLLEEPGARTPDETEDEMQEVAA